MLPISLFLSSSSESEEEAPGKIRRRIRDASNPLEIPDASFTTLFRLSKPAFKFVLDEIKNEFKVRSRSSSIPPILKFAAVLRFFASGAYQQNIGQDYFVGMSQSEMSKVLTEVLNIMERKLCAKWISFPSDQEKSQSKQHFYEKYEFPGVMGCVDGTHINIVRPTENEHLFFNRKGKHSINVMIVSNHEMKILCVDSRYGGASHDSFIWSQSVLRQKLEDDFRNGDSGYPLQPWLITPFRNSAEGSRESNFNSKLSKCRSIVERTIGLLKMRFRCLLGARELHYTPRKAAQITNVCCALHNICRNFSVDFDLAEVEVSTRTNDIQREEYAEDNNAGRSIRLEILNTMF